MAAGELVAGLKLITDGVKALTGIADSIKNAEVKKVTIDMGNHVISLQTQMFDLLSQNALLQEENRNLKIKVDEKEDFKEFKDNLYFHGDVYWLLDEGDKPIHAYCPICADSKNLKIKVVKKYGSGFYWWTCHNCKYEVHHTEAPED